MTALRKSNGQFATGWQGGPGRKPGQRNRLSELALQALGDDFAEHGAATIAKVRREKPHVYLQIIGALLPRQLTVEKVNPLAELTDDELALMEQTLAAVRAKLVSQIEPASPDISEPSE